MSSITSKQLLARLNLRIEELAARFGDSRELRFLIPNELMKLAPGNWADLLLAKYYELRPLDRGGGGRKITFIITGVARPDEYLDTAVGELLKELRAPLQLEHRPH